MKNVVARLTAAAMVGGLLIASSGVAHAALRLPALQASAASLSGDDHGDGRPGELFVDPRQEYNVSNCYFDKSKSGQERAKYCKALAGSDLTQDQKDCLKKAGLAGAGALTLGRINNKKAREIVVNTTGAALLGCFSTLVK
ncbi:hypothetical protein QEZ40_003833 [Streptomyces katrae]|uniref:Uncharacterized protein n=1 Tax=Streptomyces katrae TaxID=68223 RepID=A0ABT7GZH6_9ACTN|nr:hypothetical protein [Streptomyces katrae]MDK9498644.1 hypothetical protein [Streptomyces katrae]